MRIAIALVLIGSLTAAFGSTASARSGGGVRWFASPSRNISCELDVGRAGITNGAYCQTLSPPRSVKLTTAGAVKVCTGRTCIGNPPSGTPTLAYGKSVAFGPFHCSSMSTGVRCVVKSGAGFVISRTSVSKLKGSGPPVTPPGPTPS